ncbi:unnamed protein product [Paramecium octaurelia]|uniref:PDZ GRASP-type domain-containing protein n=1 Tax=Paramecium octaurelia TaxID=43137 RepID=A0A8S1XHE8_PAROT|nr:unnamed protein product [Paramecium octaurelia]
MGNNSSQIGNGYGYRIISIEPNSFGSNLNLEIFLDYIVQIKSDSQVNALKLLESDEPIELSILNIFSMETRKIYISEPRSTIKLGLYIRYESINPLILHITKVLKGSPAESSGLKSNQDYLLGVKSHRCQTIDEFSDIVTGQAYSKQSIELCIFSPLTKKSPRVVVLEPKFNWGGPGALGCEFASGALHSFNFSQLIKPQEGDENREVQNHEDNQQLQNEEQKQKQQSENRVQNEIILNNQEDQQVELNKSISLDKINDAQEHSIDKALSLSCSQISESKQNTKSSVQQENQQGVDQQQIISQVEMKNSQQIDESSILADLDNQQKQQQNFEQIQSDILLPETPTNFGISQQDTQFENGIDEQGEVTKFKGVLRFQKEGQEPYLEKEEVKQIDHLNSSFQLKNASSDYSHLEQNKNEIQVQPQSTVSQQDNESKNVVVKYVNQLVFKSPKREQMYVVDKKLLFDIQFEVPKYYVNIY